MAINRFIAVLDTCVLAPMPIVDTLLRLAEEPAFYLPRWSSGILEELDRTLTTKWKFTPSQVSRRLGKMQEAFPEALVDGYEALIPAMTNDPKDRHVLACAVRAGAHAIISNNVRHFKPECQNDFGIECLTAGEFLVNQYHLDEDVFINLLESQASERNKTLPELLKLLPQDLGHLIKV